MSAFEDFVNAELPRRPVMLTLANTGYSGDPNASVAPIINNSPIGTYFLNDADNILWQKKDVTSTSWEEVGSAANFNYVNIDNNEVIVVPTGQLMLYTEEVTILDGDLTIDGDVEHVLSSGETNALFAALSRFDSLVEETVSAGPHDAEIGKLYQCDGTITFNLPVFPNVAIGDTIGFWGLGNAGLLTLVGGSHSINTIDGLAELTKTIEIHHSIIYLVFTGSQWHVISDGLLAMFSTQTPFSWVMANATGTPRVSLGYELEYALRSAESSIRVSDSNTGTQNDFTPGGAATPWYTCWKVEFNPASDLTITGLAVDLTSDNFIHQKWVVNTGIGNVILNHLNGGSVAGNRISTPTGADYTIAPGYAISLWYDPDSTVWRPVVDALTGTSDADAIHDNVAGEISAITTKSPLAAGDFIIIEDSAAANVKKSATIADIRITESQITDLTHTDADALHDNVAGEIATITEKATPVSADLLLIEDSADTNNKKRLQVGNLPGPSAAQVASALGVTELLNAQTTTSDATVTTITTFTTTTNNTTSRFKFQVQALETATGDAALFDVAALVYRNGAGTLSTKDLVFLNGPFRDQGAWNVTFNLSGSDVQIQVTGEAAKTVKWSINGQAQEN